MTEFNFNLERKKYAEYITPNYIREIIKRDIGDVREKTLFDCACGSGQLLLNIDCKQKTGVEINELAYNCAKNNLDEVYNADYITFDDSGANYDIVIANPPFSLKATPEQLLALGTRYCFQFEKINKTLDQWFVIKSFEKAERGFYLLFPGVGYRNQEREFREWLIKNNYIEKIAIIEKSKFENTNISIMYLVLNKHKRDTSVVIQRYETQNLLNETVIDISELANNEYSLVYNFPDEQQEPIDIKQLNESIYHDIIKRFAFDMNRQIRMAKQFPDDFLFLSRDRLKADLENIIKDCEKTFDIN